VVLAHADSITTIYGQLASVSVAPGQMVRQGDVLGVIGNPVFGKVNHLFFSMKKNDRVLDPLDYLY
jgi:murein DD-endopeptidase MepM/ murein hydrolase activator NlpD